MCIAAMPKLIIIIIVYSTVYLWGKVLMNRKYLIDGWCMLTVELEGIEREI